MVQHNTWLSSFSRILRGHQPVFLEAPVEIAPRWRGGRGNPAIANLFELYQRDIARTMGNLCGLEPLVADLSEGGKDAAEYDWDNLLLAPIDALSVMTAATEAKSTFLQIGSGHATRAARAAMRHTGNPAQLVAIDSNARPEADALCDEVIRKPLISVGIDRFAALNAGDVLFIDSSHQAFMGSDVTVIFTEILPAVKPGVIVGFNNIFLPFDYPSERAGKAHNEQYLLAAYLLGGPGNFDILLANAWAQSRGLHRETMSPLWDHLGKVASERQGSTLWGFKV